MLFKGPTLTGGALRMSADGRLRVHDPDALVAGPDAAAYLPHVTGAMVRKWASRGWSAFIRDEHGKLVRNEHGEPIREHRKLQAVDHNGPRRSARYRWIDVLDAERDTRRNPKSPGRSRPKELALV